MARQRGRRHFIKAINADNLFNNIGAIGCVINIRSPAWRRHLPDFAGLDIKAQLFQNRLHIAFGNFKAGQLLHALRVKAHGFGLLRHITGGHRLAHCAATNLDNHLHRQIKAAVNRGRVNAAFKPIARIAVYIMVPP